MRSWTCTSCDRHTTIGSNDVAQSSSVLMTSTSREAGEGISLTSQLTKCPNPGCGALDFIVHAWFGTPDLLTPYPNTLKQITNPVGIGYFRFWPTTSKPLSADVPEGIQEDYKEAWLIKNLSPKASATLARRALQGMIRDFWKISARTLAAELKGIEDKCDRDLYQAMMALKSIGNIGAHPEQDVSTIIEIEADEAKQLLDLIHLLDQEWYVARASRRARINAVTALATAKKAT